MLLELDLAPGAAAYGPMLAAGLLDFYLLYLYFNKMYRYDDIDQRIVDERVAQFRDQTRRFLAGKLSEDEFRALRLRNGLYIQRYAPMLRIAIPYGLVVDRSN